VSDPNHDGLMAAAKVFRDLAASIAGRRSRRIPIATKVSDQGETEVDVVTDGELAPNAAPFEYAEMHPLWASVGSTRYDRFPADWGRQPLFPYMDMAMNAGLDKAAQTYGDITIDGWCKQLGWDD
jgi:hypothetical protein